MRVFKTTLGITIAIAIAGCAPYTHHFYDIDVPGRVLSNRCGVPETAKFSYHGIDIRIGVNVESMSSRFTLLIDVPEGTAARFLTDIVTVQEPASQRAPSKRYLLQTYNSEYTGIASPTGFMKGQTSVRKSLFGDVITYNTFYFDLQPAFNANESNGVLTLPSMEISGTVYPPLVVPYHKASQFVFASLNGC